MISLIISSYATMGSRLDDRGDVRFSWCRTLEGSSTSRQFSFLKTLCFQLFPKFIYLFIIHVFQQTLNVLMEFFSIIFLCLCLFRSAGSVRTIFSKMSLFSATKAQPFLHAFSMSFRHHSIDIHHVQVLFGKCKASGIVVWFLLFFLLFGFLFVLFPIIGGFLFVLGSSSHDALHSVELVIKFLCPFVMSFYSVERKLKGKESFLEFPG